MSYSLMTNQETLRLNNTNWGVLHASLYFFFLLLFFLVISIIWHTVANGSFYYCSDAVPVLDFFPPFVHSEFGDYYKVPPAIVYFSWVVFSLATLILPALFTKIIVQLWANEKKKKRLP